MSFGLGSKKSTETWKENGFCNGQKKKLNSNSNFTSELGDFTQIVYNLSGLKFLICKTELIHTPPGALTGGLHLPGFI